MKNKGFADRLNQCLDKEGFPPKNRGRIQLLAEMVGLTHRGASKWINGEGSPPAKKFASLAKKLGVSEIWLRTGVEDSCEVEKLLGLNPNDESFLIDVNLYSLDSILKDKKDILKVIKCTLPCKGNFFGIILETEAMSPRFPKGSVIILDRSIAKDGDFVLIDYNEFPIPIFRQLFIIGGCMYLNAHNPKFDRLILSESNRIIGRLVQAILSFA